MKREVEFTSDGLTLRGTLQTPDLGSAERGRAAFIILHGFGGTSGGRDGQTAAAFLSGLGYATLLFDFRGCGRSDGERGRIICLEQVRDAQNAVSFMQSQPGVAPDAIALAGSSLGAAVAIYAGAVDDRVAAVLSNGGWGDGERKFRRQHATEDGWRTFTARLAEGARHKAETGQSMMLSRFEIVPIPEHLRNQIPPGAIMEFPVETAQSMFDFRPDDMVGSIAPRPLLLTHAAHDTVTPTEQSMELLRRAGKPAELHLFSDIDHFTMFDNSRVRGVVGPWLDHFFPAQRRA